MTGNTALYLRKSNLLYLMANWQIKIHHFFFFLYRHLLFMYNIVINYEIMYLFFDIFPRKWAMARIVCKIK